MQFVAKITLNVFLKPFDTIEKYTKSLENDLLTHAFKSTDDEKRHTFTFYKLYWDKNKINDALEDYFIRDSFLIHMPIGDIPMKEAIEYVQSKKPFDLILYFDEEAHPVNEIHI